MTRIIVREERKRKFTLRRALARIGDLANRQPHGPIPPRTVALVKAWLHYLHLRVHDLPAIDAEPGAVVLKWPEYDPKFWPEGLLRIHNDGTVTGSPRGAHKL